MLVRSILINNNYRDYIKSSQDIVNVAINSPKLPINTKDLTIFFSKPFNPPIIDLETKITRSEYGNYDPNDPPAVLSDSLFTNHGIETLLDL